MTTPLTCTQIENLAALFGWFAITIDDAGHNGPDSLDIQHLATIPGPAWMVLLEVLIADGLLDRDATVAHLRRYSLQLTSEAIPDTRMEH